MPSPRPIPIQIAGRTYHVNSSVEEGEVEDLARRVEERCRQITRGKPVTPDTFLLAALSFAHDAESEQKARKDVEVRAKDLLRRMVIRIDAALDEAADEAAEAEEAAERSEGSGDPAQT